MLSEHIYINLIIGEFRGAILAVKGIKLNICILPVDFYHKKNKEFPGPWVKIGLL